MNISYEYEIFISAIDFFNFIFNGGSLCQHQLLFYMLYSIDLHNRPLHCSCMIFCCWTSIGHKLMGIFFFKFEDARNGKGW